MIKRKPSAIEIAYRDAHQLFKAFAHQPWAFLLDSADSQRQMEDTNRFSYIAFDPFEKIIIKDKKNQITSESVEQPFEYLRSILSNYEMAHHPALPPFQGGAMGYFSYDLCHYLEEIDKPSQATNTVFADLAMGLYDVVISFDHVLKQAWIVSTGWSDHANEKIQYCLDIIDHNDNYLSNEEEQFVAIDLVSPFDKNSYSELVKKSQDYILAGDIYEVNLSHQFQAHLPLPLKNSYALYMKMRQHNPSPFSAYLNLGDHHLLSTSPERFLSLDQAGWVSTRPIKGTAPRGSTAEQDQLNADNLYASEKDRAENIMIADLMRNDLSKVCTKDSVKVKKLCGVESYPTVHHLVTVVEGQLREGVTAPDLLKACFPGGSVTGAPKVRAMQIIYELEPTARGPYCGSIGYVGFNGLMDTSIVIRTVLLQENTLSYQVGGAVVLDSSPEGEYEETIVKSRSIRKTLAAVDALVDNNDGGES